MFENDLNRLAYRIHAANREAGFWPEDRERPLTETTMLIVTELSEAIEEDRVGRGPLWYREDGKPEGVDVELIDALIRLLDLLGARGVDIERLMNEKLDYNKGRGVRHGKEY